MRATIPWDTVSDQHPPGTGRLDRLERGKRPGRVIRERCRLRADGSGQDVRAGRERVADHDRIDRWEVVADAAWRVAGKRNDVRRTRDVESLAPDQLVHLGQVRRAQASVPTRV